MKKPRRLEVLRLLARHPQPTTRELAEIMGVSVSRVAGLLTQLEAHRLVRRTGKARSVEVLP
jgi:DNA-binding IclR family transcriptional regulator